MTEPYLFAVRDKFMEDCTNLEDVRVKLSKSTMDFMRAMIKLNKQKSYRGINNVDFCKLVAEFAEVKSTTNIFVDDKTGMQAPIFIDPNIFVTSNHFDGFA